MNLARCYETVKRYAEALTLIQHASIYLREARGAVSQPDSDVITIGDPPYFPLSTADLTQIERDLTGYGLNLKKDWFAYNGGSTNPDNGAYKKPLFFNVALNYVPLDMGRLEERAGKKKPVRVAEPAARAPEAPVEKRQAAAVKARVEEVRPATPEVKGPARSGLSSLLGGWWGKS